MHKDCIVLCDTVDAQNELLCMKEINGRPFISYLATYLKKFHICKVIFAISHHKSTFKDYVLNHREEFSFAFDFAESEEHTTSGRAILNALQYSDTPDVFIMDGHRYFDVNLDDLIAWQQTKMGDVTLALAPQPTTSGQITAHLDEKNFVHEFKQGVEQNSGLVLSGIYCMFRPSFLNINFPHDFSFVETYLKKYLKERDFIGMISDGYFIDISRHDALEKACTDFPSIF